MSGLVWTVLESEEDASVNFIADTEDGGKIETRFVQREPGYFIVYLSSHTGCNKSCRMCHLTATGQTYFTPVTPEQYLEQAEQVINYCWSKLLKVTDTVHFNFMARGEPLANPHMLRPTNWHDIWHDIRHDFWGKRDYSDPTTSKVFLPLLQLAHNKGLTPKIKISTIMPTEVAEIDLYDLTVGAAQFYYSLYSVDEQFRRRWVPKALPTSAALEKLYAYQNQTPIVDDPVVFHWAFIDGQNDSIEDVEAVIRTVADSGVTGKFNLVRYNPPNDKSKESSPEIIERNFKILSEAFDHPGSRIVPRVGFDVKASCGMFV